MYSPVVILAGRGSRIPAGASRTRRSSLCAAMLTAALRISPRPQSKPSPPSDDRAVVQERLPIEAPELQSDRHAVLWLRGVEVKPDGASERLADIGPLA